MFRAFRRIAFVVSVPAALAFGGWVQWTTFAADDATVAVSTSDASRVDVPRERADTRAAEPRIKATPVLDRTAEGGAQPADPAVKFNTAPAKAKIVTYRIKPDPIPDRTAGDGTQPPVPAAKADTELAQADAVTDRRSKPAPSPDRLAGDGAAETAQAAAPAAKGKATTGQAEPPASAAVAGVGSVPANANVADAPIEPVHAAERTELSGGTTKVAPAEPQAPKSPVKELATKEASTKATRERQASLARETKEYRPPREHARETRRIQSVATDARRASVARHWHAEPARQQWFSGIRTISERDRTTCW